MTIFSRILAVFLFLSFSGNGYGSYQRVDNPAFTEQASPLRVSLPTLGPTLGVLSDNKTRFWLRGPVYDQSSIFPCRREVLPNLDHTAVLQVRPHGNEEWTIQQSFLMKVYHLEGESPVSQSAKNVMDFVGIKDLDLECGQYDYRCGVVSSVSGIEVSEKDLDGLNWNLFETHTFSVGDPNQIKDTSFIFGSCRHYFTNVLGIFNPGLQDSDEIFGHVNSCEDTSVIAFLGDNGYADPGNFLWRANKYHQFMRVNEAFMSTPHMKELLATTRTVCMADDHEVRNDFKIEEDREEQYFQAALEAYNTYQYMRTAGFNPESQMPSGSYEFPINGIPAFMLDARMNRTSEPKRLISDDDMQKLKDWLLTHKEDPFKVLFSGVPMFPGYAHNEHEDGDKWRGHEVQLKTLLQFIDEKEISGLVICSGDIHKSCASQIRTPNGVKITNLISSPFHWRLPNDIGNRYFLDIQTGDNDRPLREEFMAGYPYVAYSPIYSVDTFGRVFFREDRRLEFFLYGRDGSVLNAGGPFAKGVKL